MHVALHRDGRIVLFAGERRILGSLPGTCDSFHSWLIFRQQGGYCGWSDRCSSLDILAGHDATMTCGPYIGSPSGRA